MTGGDTEPQSNMFLTGEGQFSRHHIFHQNTDGIIPKPVYVCHSLVGCWFHWVLCGSYKVFMIFPLTNNGLWLRHIRDWAWDFIRWVSHELLYNDVTWLPPLSPIMIYRRRWRISALGGKHVLRRFTETTLEDNVQSFVFGGWLRIRCHLLVPEQTY